MVIYLSGQQNWNAFADFRFSLLGWLSLCVFANANAMPGHSQNRLE